MARLKIFRTAAVCTVWLLAFCDLPGFAQERIVNILGWSDYINPDVIGDFAEETGIKVTYDSYDSEEALEKRLRLGKESFDVVIVSGPALSKQIARGYYLKLDMNRLPNAKYLSPELMALLSTYDLGNHYAVNYMWFTIGISYNVKKTENIFESQVAAPPRASPHPLAVPAFDSWSVLFKSENLRKFSSCGIGVVDDPEYLLAIARRYLWSDWRSAVGLSQETDRKRAADILRGILHDVKKLSNSNYVAALANGEICLAVGSSLDSFRARDQALEAKNEVEINYVLPREGAPVLLDNLAIPKGSLHIEEAYQFINFLMRPEIAARNTDFTHAANGVPASKPLVVRKISEDKSVYPDAAFIQRLFVPEKRDSAAQDAFVREWARTK